MNVAQEYYTVKEVAELLKTHYMTIYREIKRGKLDAYKVANDYRISKEALAEYLNRNKVKTEKKR